MEEDNSEEIIEEAEEVQAPTEEPAKTEAPKAQQNLTGNFGNTPLAR
jgi:hypothetical protein